MTNLKTVTLGCKVNQYETEYVRQGLLEAGFTDCPDKTPADLCVVNTCTVTAEGDAKSRQAIRRLARENPHARIVVMGCYATRSPREVAELPNVAEVVTDKRELPDLLGRHGVIDIPTGISHFGDRHRAYVKIQDGCLLRCSYCVIPLVRPNLTSRPVDHILQEVGRLVDNGYREVVLSGIHLGHYGVDWNVRRTKQQWFRLADLLRQIVRLNGQFRVRLSSIEATEVTRELIDVMAEFPHKICPHLHVCLQSGADSVLRRMKRRWCSKRIIDRCLRVREALDRPAFTTDVIVGFPAESDAEFQQTCDVVREIGFWKVHVFPFSARRGTPAATMADQIPKRIKSSRGKHLRAIAMDMRNRFFHQLLGRRLQVLIESRVEGLQGRVAGTACRYMPVELPGETDRLGQLQDVLASHVQDDRIIATSAR